MVERASRPARTRGRSPAQTRGRSQGRARSREADRPTPEEWNNAYKRYIEDIPECANLYLEKHPTFSLYCKICDKCFDPSHAECDKHIKNLQYHHLTHAWIVFQGDDWYTGKWILQEWPQQLNDPYAVVGLPSRAVVPQAPWLLPFYNGQAGAQDPYDYNPPPPTHNYWQGPSASSFPACLFPSLKDGTVDDAPPPSLSSIIHTPLKTPNPFVRTTPHSAQPHTAGAPSFLAPYMSAADATPLPPLPTGADTATIPAPQPTLTSLLSAALNHEPAPALSSSAPPLPGQASYVMPQSSHERPLPPDVPGHHNLPPLPRQQQPQQQSQQQPQQQPQQPHTAPPRQASPPPPVEERRQRRESPPPPASSERRDGSARRVSPSPVREGEKKPEAGIRLECADECFSAVVDTFCRSHDGLFRGTTYGATIERDDDTWKLVYKGILVATVLSDRSDKAPPVKGWMHKKKDAPFQMRRIIVQ
eukprot:GEMP01033056.1.p1 GENE.GEMP01033056.1~~GEMP01033056.1.p1  ORF type:complete len:475 (-),score=127.23 GEMP01033056.1:673-2097(-)